MPIIIPPTTTHPICFLFSDPAPDAIASGSAPSTIAKVVINIGGDSALHEAAGGEGSDDDVDYTSAATNAVCLQCRLRAQARRIPNTRGLAETHS